MKVLRHLLFACAAAVSLGGDSLPENPTAEPAPPPPPPEDPRDAAKREAWTSAVLIFSLLEQGDQRAFPGIRSWLEDFRRVAATTPAPESGKPFPLVDADALVTRNPHFWAAFYEVQPGDPGLALLHSALLLSGGEAQRAAVVAALGLQRTGAPEEIRRGLHSIIAHCGAAQSRSMDIVRLGVRLHDMAEYEVAVQQFDLALEEWPANGRAHYERGSALRLAAIAAARRAGTLDEEKPIPDSPEILAAFAAARRHDPLHLLAYQGEEVAHRAALVALVNEGLPVWDAIHRKPETPVRTTAWRTFSEACRVAAIDDFALVLRQLVVASDRHYAQEDAELIQVCLNRLAPAALTPELVARVTGEVRVATRQIVVPAAVEPPDSPEIVAKPSAKAAPLKKAAASGGHKKSKAASAGSRPSSSKVKSGRKRKS